MMLTFFMVAWMISALLLMIGNFVAFVMPTRSSGKQNPFECGFESFSSIRQPFSVRFFVLVVLFLIFDVEAVLLIPCLLGTIGAGGTLPFIYMHCFLALLLIGLLIEWKNGVFDWK
uniref:NADH dehydrogenase subunit 3 n=1 Tax=Satsuma myomphala TaxID=358001 RepID=UPI0030015FA5